MRPLGGGNGRGENSKGNRGMCLAKAFPFNGNWLRLLGDDIHSLKKKWG